MKAPTNTLMEGYRNILRRGYLWVEGIRGWRLSKDEGGAAMTEYVVLLGTVSLGVAAAIASLGPSLVAEFERARTMLISPMP